MSQDKLYQVALSLVPKIGPVLSRQLINYFESPETILSTPKGKLAKIPRVGEKLSALIPKQKDLLFKAEKVMRESSKRNIDIHYYKESSYPKRLLSINDAPIVLYSKGQLNLNPVKTLGIVGTRKATRYGLNTTDKIVAEAQKQQPTIISGLAYGIDIRSHRAALDQHLPTIGVLACGLDRMYPQVHFNTAEQMLEKGGLLSEYATGTQPDPRLFPARNRIIAALSDALVVVEAARKGGALISANIAHSYDRPVFAIPGNLYHSHSEGCNQLIRSMKAGIYTSFQDVVNELGWQNEADTRSRNSNQNYLGLKGEEKKVVDTLLKNGRQLHIDQLSWQAQIPLSQLAGVLLRLEFSGFVKSLPGKEYALI